MKPNYKTLKSTRKYIKYSGLKKHGRQKPNLRRHQCEVCNKTFNNEMMMDFHKRTHPRQLSLKDFKYNLNDRVNLNNGNSLIHKSNYREKSNFNSIYKQVRKLLIYF